MGTYDLNQAFLIMALLYGGSAAMFSKTLGAAVVFSLLHIAATLNGVYSDIYDWASWAQFWFALYAVVVYMTFGRK